MAMVAVVWLELVPKVDPAPSINGEAPLAVHEKLGGICEYLFLS